MSYDYTARKRSLECLFGLSALDKIKSLYRFASSELRCLPLGRKLGVKLLAAIGIRTKKIPASEECTWSAMLLWFNVSYSEKMGCGSPVVRVSDHGRHVMSSSPVPLKTRRVGQRCTLNLPRAETSSHWCGVVVRRGVASSGIVHVT
ncbi:uncharacterized protein TNCV_3493381 [Trichonephila clavipes]|nr:uncharacterized protein TNCV_3493381 [Trichonephila clavipes]